MGLLDGLVNAVIGLDKLEDRMELQRQEYRKCSTNYLVKKYENDEVLFDFVKYSALTDVLKERGYDV